MAHVLYLYAFPAHGGVGHILCRQFADELSTRHRVTRRYGVLAHEDYLQVEDQQVRAQHISDTEFLGGGYEILFVEGGLQLDPQRASARVSANVLRRFIESGGVVILHFDDHAALDIAPRLKFYNAFLGQARLPTLRDGGPAPEHWRQPGFAEYVEGHDSQHAIVPESARSDKWAGESYSSFFRIVVNDTYLRRIAAPLLRAYDGVGSLVVSRPYHLEPLYNTHVLVSGNPDTTQLWTPSGTLVWKDYSPIFAACIDNRINGLSVTVTGSLCRDAIVERYDSDNLLFMSNLVDRLLMYQRERREFLALPALVGARRESVAEGAREAGSQEEKEEIWNRLSDDFDRLSRHPQVLHHRREAKEFLRVALRRSWDELEESSRGFLVTGEAIFRAFRGAIEAWDFLPVSGEFCKALEVEIEAKFIDRFRQFLRSRGELGRFREQPAGKKMLLLSALRGRRKLSLGEFARELQRSVSGTELIYVAFREYVEASSPSPAFWWDPSKATSILTTVADRYRNSYVHSTHMPWDVCDEFRSQLLGLGEDAGWLLELLSTFPCSATGPKMTDDGRVQ